MNIHKLIEDLEEISDGYAERYNIDRTPEWFILKLTEELGEFTQSYLKYKGQARTNNKSADELKIHLEDELADVIGMALLTANNQGIDIENAFKRKWLKYLKAPRSTI